jgi:hypothetical protein
MYKRLRRIFHRAEIQNYTATLSYRWQNGFNAKSLCLVFIFGKSSDARFQPHYVFHVNLIFPAVVFLAGNCWRIHWKNA